MRGAGFPPGQVVGFSARRTRPSTHLALVLSRLTLTVPADGAFAVELDLREAVPGCVPPDFQPDPPDPDGAEYTISAGTDGDPGSHGRLLASAVFTIVNPPPPPRLGPRCFPETGRCIEGRFLAYWQGSGGLARHGLPLSGELVERLEDGRLYPVQYFERTRLEYHPENDRPGDAGYAVLLGQFGRRVLLARAGRAVDPPAVPVPDRAYFPETGHTLGGRFREYWEGSGGLAQFGFPLTEPFEEVLEDGRVYAVQYFERARFEYHPEHAPPFDVLLGQFGRQILAEAEVVR
jgi:hypothetical protein